MKQYRVQMMNNESYNNYMSGSYNYYVEEAVIEANNEAEAVANARAQFPNMMINEGYVKSVEELNRLAEEEAKRVAEAKAREEEKKAAKEAKHAAKLAAEGITEEQYKARQNAKRKANEIKNLRAKIAELEEELAKAEKAKAYYEEKARG